MLVLYVPIIVLGGLAAFFAIFSLVAGHVSGPRRWNRAKLDAYECGIEPTPPEVGSRFPVKYYLTAMLFIVTVLVAYAYVWRRGGLEWD